MRVLIVGGGLTGSYLAKELVQEGQQVTVIERREGAAAKLKEALPSLQVVIGDGDDPAVLEQAGIRTADVVVATTGEDEDNLVACLLARTEFGAPRTLARVNNPKNEWLFTPTTGVDVWVSQAHVMADLLREEMAALEMTTLLRLHEGEIALVEDILTPESRAVGRAVNELLLPEGTALVAIIRDNRVFAPRGDLVLQAGDRVLVLAQAAQRQQLAEAFD